MKNTYMMNDQAIFFVNYISYEAVIGKVRIQEIQCLKPEEVIRSSRSSSQASEISSAIKFHEGILY